MNRTYLPLRSLVKNVLLAEKLDASSTYYIVQRHHIRLPCRPHLYLQQTRGMGFWEDFKSKLKSNYESNETLKESVEELKEKAHHVGATATKVAEKVGTVKDKIQQSIPQAPDTAPLKEKAGKFSDTMKKVMDFVGNRLTFVKTDTYGAQRPVKDKATAQQAETASTTSAGAQKTTSSPPPQPAAKQKQTSVPPLENPAEAPGGGTSLVVRPTTEWERYWDKLGGRMIGEVGKKVGSRVGSILDRILPESEIALVLTKIKETSPEFTVHSFLQEMREFVPAVLEAILAGDTKSAKPLFSERYYRILFTLIREREAAGVFHDSRLLDITNIDLTDAKLPDAEKPTLFIQFQTQEIYCIRDRTGRIIEGAEDSIQAVFYIMAIQQDFSDLGWQCVDVHAQKLSSYL
jgi:predicted lipid-binding transport protein (Tim44 family)